MNDIQITLHTEWIKLDQFLKFSGATESGGQAKEAVQQGLVSVNGEICLVRGKKLRDGDRVSFQGQSWSISAPRTNE